MNPEAEWAEQHGSRKSIVYTEMRSARDGPVIVSTVLLTVGISEMEGSFWAFETRVFGGRGDGFCSSLTSTGDPKEATQIAIAEHIRGINSTAKSHLIPKAGGG